MCVMGWSHGEKWTDDLIKKELLVAIDEFGRMPSARELKGSDRGGLACAISRHGGYRSWAKKLRVGLKGTETHRAHAWETREVEFFRGHGFDVEQQGVKSPFDLLVGKVRVDVKSATWTSYEVNDGRNAVQGYVFGNLKRGQDCDVFDLICVAGRSVVARFLVPAAEAQVTTLTITPLTLEGKGKYSRFRDFMEALS